MTKTISTRISLVLIAILLVATLAIPAIVAAQPTERGGQDRGQQARAAAVERRRTAEEAREERTAEIRERVENRQAQIQADQCERRQEQLAQRIPRLATSSERLLEVLDNTYDRVQGFYNSGQLTVANYEELNEAVAAAQAEAAGSVAGLTEDFAFEFDCDNPSVGDQMFAFRESVSETRELLKAYRAELVVLISSMRAAAAEQRDASDDDQSDDDATEGNDEASDNNEEEGDA